MERKKGKILVILGFDLYGKLIGDGSGDKRITTFIYKIRTYPKHALTLKNIQNKIEMDETNDIKFIPYGLNSIGNKNTMRNIII